MIFPGMAHSLYFRMWLISCISWCGVYIALHICIAFPIMAYILYILMCVLMWRPVNCISWCGVYTILQRYIAFPYMACILNFEMWHTFCISWCGVYYIGSPYMTDVLFFRHTLYILVWRTSVFSDVAYFVYFLMWHTLHCVSWYGVYIVLQTSMIIPVMLQSLFCLM